MMKLVALVLAIFLQFPSGDAFKIEPRIVNGRVALEQQFPHYVFLDIELDERNAFRNCGGTLLNDEFVLTAAHCFNNATVIEVCLGAADIRHPHHIIPVQKQHFFKHPKYTPGFNDIGLIRLPNKVEFTLHIQPVRLPTKCEMTDNISVYAMGNGFTNDTGPISVHLQHALLTTISFQSCRITFPFLLSRKLVICALDQVNTGRNMSSTCFGDSGSPLTKLDGTLIGVTSFTRPESCEAGHPQAFTRVSSYTRWINSVTGLNLLGC